MIVEVICLTCEAYNDNPVEMEPVGNLFTSEYKDQSQEYKCPMCKHEIQVLVNTTRDK